MGAILIPVIAVIVVVAIFWIVGQRWAVGRKRVSDDLAAPATDTVDYLVPSVQDPAVILAALEAEGFTATTDPAQTHLIHVSCPAGRERDRAHIRSVIASVHTTAIDSGAPFEAENVRFSDEQGPR
jgi:hypothetical protein